MLIKTAQFLMSNTDVLKCPNPDKPEYAFIGRSNVGKSSLINMLTNHSGLAKISSTPGKTQLINHFIINEKWYLVDLPGYGYAKVSKEKRAGWNGFTKEYILNRSNLMTVFVLIDSRIEPQKNDLEFITQLGVNQIPFVLIFTKTDKQSPAKTTKNIDLFKTKMAETWEEFPQMISTSAVLKSGHDEILNFIEQTNKLFRP
jgi:GTP-binding protein